jgi:hypothetical protein
MIDGLKKAIRIIECRLHTAHGLNFDEVYIAAYEDALVFLKAELYRQEHPEHAAKTRTVVD